MKRRISAVLCAAVLMAVAASSASADRGSPGTTFPEQPGAHVLGACLAINTNPGTGIGGTVGNHISPTAGAITSGLLADACTVD